MTNHFLITGSRDFPRQHYAAIVGTLDGYMIMHPGSVMINGLARGADTLCLEWAKHRGVEVEGFPANWDKYHKAAGPIRNKEMLDRLLETNSTDVRAFVYGSLTTSRGTANMVSQCRKAGLSPIVIEVPRG